LLAECAAFEKQPVFSFPTENYTPENFIYGVVENFAAHVQAPSVVTQGHRLSLQSTVISTGE
jgi:hypothetical protein